MKKNVTAKDIAKLCGVSQATVSYVINNRQNQKISEETRRKVLKHFTTIPMLPPKACGPKTVHPSELYVQRITAARLS